MSEQLQPIFQFNLQGGHSTATFGDYMYILSDIRNSVQGIKAIIEAFKNGERVHKDTLCLTTSKSRKTFAREAGESKLIYGHLLKIEEMIAKEFAIAPSHKTEGAKIELSAEEISEAKIFLQSPKLMFKVVEMVRNLGVVGEEAVLLIHYLAFISRITQHPLSIVVKGDSAAGKSYVLSRVMRLIPSEAYEEFTDATGQSFYYAPEGAYSHKIIVIFEKEGTTKTQNPIRTFQSEGKLRIQVTIKNPDTNQFETVVKEVKGPVGIITTTTHPNIHAENETRCFSIFPNESIEQTERILGTISKRYQKGHTQIDEAFLRPFHNLQRILKPYPVIIPFIDAIEKAFPKSITRVRRDYERFLALIEVIAIFHQEQRKKIDDNGTEKIVAALTDYGCAWCISKHILARTIFGISPRTEQVLEAMKRIEEKHMDKDIPLEPVTVNELSQELKWDTDTAAKWLKPAVAKGFVEVAETSAGRKPAKYKLCEKEWQKTVLPHPKELLFQTETDELQTNISLYNPLTGNDGED